MSTVSDARPIGVFDSGVGGLTVVAALMRQLPHEPILYLGDTARLPYGTKSRATVLRYSQRNVDFLRSRGVKAVVVACNTASALALPALETDLPIWGVIEPGARRALEATRGRVGVIATESTIASDAYGKALRTLAPSLALPNLVVVGQPCPLFVPLVEEGWHDDPVTELVARRYLTSLVEAAVDTVVLGCTHYPLLATVIGRVMGPEVRLVDSARATAEAVARGLAELNLEAPPEHEPEHHLCVTDLADRFARMERLILGSGARRLELVDVR